MSVQVLVATMQQKKGDYSLLKKMNIQTPAIVCNQCDRNEFEEFLYNSNKIRWLSFAEKGVGLNRNNALMRAENSLIMFADDDMEYVNGYDKIVERAYEELPFADIIVFNLIEKSPVRYIIPKIKRVGYLNFLRYGAARITAKNSSVKKNGIFFNTCFGGGAEYCSGEDNLFLSNCLDKGLKIYAYPAYIAKLTEERESTWDFVNSKKKMIDKGFLFKIMSKRWWKFLCLQDAIRREKRNEMGWIEAYRLMTKQ